MTNICKTCSFWGGTLLSTELPCSWLGGISEATGTCEAHTKNLSQIHTGLTSKKVKALLSDEKPKTYDDSHPYKNNNWMRGKKDVT